MKTLMVFLVQTIVLFSLAKATVKLIIPLPIRKLMKKAFYGGISAIMHLVLCIYNDFEEDVDEEDNVIDFEKIKKRSVK